MTQSWSYDWLGNTTTSTDDANLFYDRSLGTITNTGYRLTSAPGSGGNHLTAEYDAAGYMSSMTVQRAGNCAPANQCSTQVYQYKWDEVGRLVDATRQDPSGPGAHLEFAYDASDNRVRKTVVSGEDSRHTVYVFGSLELRLAEFTATGYTVDDSTEVPYLFGHGVRLARVTYTDAADFQADRRRIFLELGDHLGSTSVVLDHATGELVERSTAFAYGSAESNYRTQRWDHFREDYRFTGKEDDIEVGLIYFGARYLNPQLGRWISADPLAVHAPGKADLNLYAYVHGRVLSAVDPVGLQSQPSAANANARGGPNDQPVAAAPANTPGSSCGSGCVYGANGQMEVDAQSAAPSTTAGGHGSPGQQAGPATKPDGNGVTEVIAGGVVMAAAVAIIPATVLMGIGAVLVVTAPNHDSDLPSLDGRGKEKGGAAQIVTGVSLGGAGALKAMNGARPSPAPASPKPVPPRIPRLKQDVDIHPTPPRALPLNRPIGNSPAQNAELQADIAAARAAGGTDFRVNQQQVNSRGVRVGINRPDLQYTDANGIRQYVEYDTPTSGRGPGHRSRILANDPAGNVTLKEIP